MLEEPTVIVALATEDMAKAAAPTTPKSIFRIFVAPTFIPVAGLQQTAGDSAIGTVTRFRPRR